VRVKVQGTPIAVTVVANHQVQGRCEYFIAGHMFRERNRAQGWETQNYNAQRQLTQIFGSGEGFRERDTACLGNWTEK
jgi:hypothetical protein